MLNGDHPRTLFDARELEALRNARAGSHQELADVLRRALDRYRNSTSFDAGDTDGVAGYAAAAVLFGGTSTVPADDGYPQYLQVAQASLERLRARAVGAEDLKRAAYVRNLAVGYDVLHDQLSDTE